MSVVSWGLSSGGELREGQFWWGELSGGGQLWWGDTKGAGVAVMGDFHSTKVATFSLDLRLS